MRALSVADIDSAVVVAGMDYRDLIIQIHSLGMFRGPGVGCSGLPRQILLCPA